MQLGRRDLLRLGAAVAVSLVATSCRGEQPLPRQAATSAPPPPSPRLSARGASPTALQPAPGHLYYGASVPHHRSLPVWESQLGRPLAVHRSYFTPDPNETAQLVRSCLDDLASDRLPHVSVKPRGTWQEIASGAQDDWLASMLVPLAGTRAPLLFTLHHEPENDAGPPGMQPADFVAMQRRLIDLAAEKAPQVVVAPVLQQWTFDPVRDDIDPAAWIVPEASVMGLDVYNHWSPTNGRPWSSFGTKADDAISWVGDKPIVIGEYGCREDPDNPGLAAEWLRDAAQYAREHNIISMSYFNSDLNAPDGSWELRGRTEQAFADLLASDWVARPG